MLNKYILAIDQGTTGSRAFVFNAQGKVVASSYQEFRQYFPKPGWVEHDANEIWASVVAVIGRAVKAAKISPSMIAAIGITNQRETTLLWDRRTGKPVHKAIVWQCRRTAEDCVKLKKHEALFRRKTGLVLDAYFSGTKIAWLLNHVPGLRQKAKAGHIAFGTMDAWLIYKLTGGKVHATDFTNASRTLIFNIHKKQWDQDLMKVLNIPSSILPNVMSSGSTFGFTTGEVAHLPKGIPINAVMGDQQAALYGQGCWTSGTMKNTYGTGCFMLLNTGKKFVGSRKGLLTTLACDIQGEAVYALEGAVFIAGAVVQWLRDGLKVIKSSSQTEEMIRGLKDTGGVYFVPAFVGLGAPYWNPHARGAIVGLTRGTQTRHIVRAALESMAYQTKDLVLLMEEESKVAITSINVDGGACRNNFLMQFQADMLRINVCRPKMVDTTVAGVAHLAGLKTGVWSTGKLAGMGAVDHVFKARMPKGMSDKLYLGWQVAVARTL